MKTLKIEVTHKGTPNETHSVILTDHASGYASNVTYAYTPRGAKMCLTRYAKSNGFEMVDGVWSK